MRRAAARLGMWSCWAVTAACGVASVAARGHYLGLHGPVGPATTAGAGIDRGELTVGCYRSPPPATADPFETFYLASAGPPLADQLQHAVAGFGWGHNQSTGGASVTAVDVPIWFPGLLGLMTAFALRARSRRSPDRPGACRRCGYDLRASPQRCPECGAVDAAVA